MVETVTPAYLSQEAVSTLSAAIELRGAQTTVMSNWTLLIPAGVPLTAESQVTDLAGAVYRVSGSVAQRRGLSTSSRFQAASLRLISDLEGD